MGHKHTREQQEWKAAAAPKGLSWGMGGWGPFSNYMQNDMSA